MVTCCLSSQILEFIIKCKHIRTKEYFDHFIARFTFLTGTCNTKKCLLTNNHKVSFDSDTFNLMWLNDMVNDVQQFHDNKMENILET